MIPITQLKLMPEVNEIDKASKWRTFSIIIKTILNQSKETRVISNLKYNSIKIVCFVYDVTYLTHDVR